MFIAKKYSTFNEFIFFSEYSVLLSLVKDWNSKISYGLRTIHEQRGVRICWLARVDVI